MKAYIAMIAFAALASGCGSFSGLDGSSTFACKAPDGVACTSVSGVYANPPVVEKVVPTQSGVSIPADKPDPAKAKAPATPELPPYGQTSFFHAIPANGTPLLTPPKVLRIWVAPWKDQDGDLRDQSFLYVMWDRGEWNIQHSQEQILRQYAPVRLRQAGALPSGAPSAAAPAVQEDGEMTKDTPPFLETGHGE
jgi:conjugal transfer pilus assembly protein TraV